MIGSLFRQVLLCSLHSGCSNPTVKLIEVFFFFNQQESVNQKEVDCLSLGPNVGEPIASISESSPRSISASSDGVAASSSAASSCTSTSSSNRGFPSKELDSDEELDLLTDMIQTAQFHHPHPRAFQVCQIF